jgi:ATP-dependent Clp protease ATP-binding subunit ClpA
MLNKTRFIKNNREITSDSLRAHAFTENAITVFKHSVERAIARGGLYGVLHPVLILWAMLRWERNVSKRVLEGGCGVDLLTLENDIEDILNGMRTGEAKDIECQRISEIAVAAKQEASKLGREFVATEDMVLALLAMQDDILQELFTKHKVSYCLFKEKLAELRNRSGTKQ